MATARGSNHAAYRVKETSFKVTPDNPAFIQFRQTGFKLNVERDPLVSKEITSTRHKRNVTFGAQKVIGEAGGELAWGAHDDWMEAAVMGTWAPKATRTAATIAAVAADNSITDSGNGFVAAGFQVGDKIRTTGFATAANNKTRVAATVVAGKITFGADGDDIVDEAAGAAVTVRTRADVLKTAATSRTFTIERHFTDVNVLLRFDGCKVGKMSFKTAANSMVDLSFSILGSEGTMNDIDTGKLTGATYEETANTVPMTSNSGVLTEGEEVTASVSELSFDLDNEVAGEYVIGKDISNEPTEGDSNLTGSSTVLFKEARMLAKWMNNEEDKLSASFSDAAGNTYIFEIPRFALLGAPVDVAGKGAIPIATPFQALEDVAMMTNIVITRIPAI